MEKLEEMPFTLEHQFGVKILGKSEDRSTLLEYGGHLHWELVKLARVSEKLKYDNWDINIWLISPGSLKIKLCWCSFLAG